ncbi:synaptosomal-associated protein 29-like [Uloborus diversus]|uniref:synaptosomal-associated protein 29-like n=1 Tax=Uloborus diversus TaxID=327109 RepID=UPI00240A9C3F|nr:synaptosomal-associated protein 29-like [Uloborus diversus]
MAKELKSNPFLDDDEDVDDYQFLNHPRQGQSGYMLGNGQERNEWENKRMQLLEERRRIEERTLQSTNTSLGLLHESEQVGILTAEELLKQREQLQNIEGNLDNINSTMKISQKHINSLKSIFGGLKNYFSKGGSSEASLPPEGVRPSPEGGPSPLADTVGHLRAEARANEGSHPAFRARDLSFDDLDAGEKKSPVQASGSRDIDDKIDKNLDFLTSGLGRLKNLAVGLHDEIELQNEMIDVIHDKADRADETLEYQNRQIKRILKK